MKNANKGIIRRIDSVGRLVVPIDYYRQLGISKFDPIEITAEEDCVVLRKYNDKEKSLEEDLVEILDKYENKERQDNTEKQDEKTTLLAKKIRELLEINASLK